MTQFKEFEGLHISGKVAIARDGIIKMYRSQKVLNKAVIKARKDSFDCKAVKNGNSWAIILN